MVWLRLRAKLRRGELQAASCSLSALALQAPVWAARRKSTESFRLTSAVRLNAQPENRPSVTLIDC